MERLVFWANNFETVYQGDSLAIPWEGDPFAGKSVLEIGPGGGRQFIVASRKASRYAVADISKEAIDVDLYKDIKRYLIHDYNQDLRDRFEIIHFWYVLHHVKRSELGDFCKFIYRHLIPGGRAIFNTPVTDYPEAAYGDNGILTTRWNLEEVRKGFETVLSIVSVIRVWKNSTGYVITVERDKLINGI